MREHSAGRSSGRRIAVAGLFAVLAGGLFWAPAATASENAAAVRDAGSTWPSLPERPADRPDRPADRPSDRPEQGEPGSGLPGTGSSWTLRPAVEDGANFTVSVTTSSGVPDSVTTTVTGAVTSSVAGTVTGTLPDGSSWT